MKTIRKAKPDQLFRVKTSVTSFLISAMVIIYLNYQSTDFILGKFDKNWQLRYLFTAQLKSLLHMKFYVDNNSAYGECYVYHQHCFSYYGIAPSILRLPLYLIFGDHGFTTEMVIASQLFVLATSFIVLNLGFQYVLSRVLVDTQNKKTQMKIKIGFKAAALLVGPGNIIIQNSFPSGYWEAISWSAGFILLGISLIILWLESMNLKWLIMSTISFIFAANSRPTAILTSFTLGSALFLYGFISLKLRNLKFVFSIAALTFGPLLTAGSVFLIKFGTLFPSFNVYSSAKNSETWKSILHINGNSTFSLKFIPSNLLAYLRPDSFKFDKFNIVVARPIYEGFTYLFPLKNGSMFIAEGTVGILAISFGSFLITLNLIGSFQIMKNKISSHNYLQLQIIRILLLGALSGTLLNLTFVYNANRYLGDYAPGLVFGVAFGVPIYLMKIHKLEINIFKAFSLSLIIFQGILFNILIAYSEAVKHSHWGL